MGEFEGKVMSLFYKNNVLKNLKNKRVVSSPSTRGLSGSPIILEKTGEVIGVLVMSYPVFDH